MTSVLPIKQSVRYVPLSQSHAHTRVSGVQVPYRGFSNEADQWVLSTDTRPLTTAQHGVGNVCVCTCVCMCVWVGTGTAGRVLSPFSSCPLSSYHIPEP